MNKQQQTELSSYDLEKRKTFSLLESRFGLTLNPDLLTRSQAKKIYESAAKIIEQVKSTPQAHSAHKDPKYLELLMVKEAMNKYMKDFKPDNAPGAKTVKMKPASSYTAVKSLTEGKATQKIGRILDLVMEGKPVPSKYMDVFAPVIHKVMEMKSAHLNESELEKSEVLLAARDVVDSLQDMIEELGKILNEQIPALSDSIRDQLGAQASSTYSGTVSQTLSGLLESLKSVRQDVDNATRALAGEEPVSLPEPTSAEPADVEEPPEDDFAALPAATGGTEPSGRAER